jgi:threonine/homoserine/homoserine lactone efflux protein
VLPFLLGFSIGVLSSIPPFGPAGLLLVRRGLEGRIADGIAAVTGGAIADATYCALAVVGFSYLFWAHPHLAALMRWVGVALLILLAIWFLAQKPQAPRTDGGNGNGGRWPHHAMLGFSLVAFNPTLLITWTSGVALLASLGNVFFSGTGKLAFPVGVALGDITWGTIALLLYRRLGTRLPDRWLRLLMRTAGVFLLVIACVVSLQIASSN